MNEDDYKLWRDAIKEVLVLKGLLSELEKKIDALYVKVDSKLDTEGE